MSPERDYVFQSATPYEASRIHAAAAYCSDGRIGEQMDEFLRQGLGLPRYDRVAVPGGPACLAGHVAGYWEARGVEEQLGFLIRAHQLSHVILINHEGCAYYRHRLRVAEGSLLAVQRKDLAKAARVVRLLDSRLDVRAFFAWRTSGGIGFEAVPV